MCKAKRQQGKGGRLPAAVDLRPWCSPVVKQGKIGSCTADAIVCGLREYLLIKAGEPWVRLSRLFLYYEERNLRGCGNWDSGAWIREGMKVLQAVGVCSESSMPYDAAGFCRPPTRQNIEEAAHYKIRDYRRVTCLEGLKGTLAEYLPVVAGLKIYGSFKSEAVRRAGVVPSPRRGERFFGWHAVLVVGYDDAKKWCIVRNSWGEEWGDKGYCYIPYDYWGRRLVTEMWTGV